MSHIIVVGNEKGGAGKSTMSMHVATALSRLGKSVAVIDLDLRQKSLGRYIENRRKFLAAEGLDLPTPGYIDLPEIDQATLQPGENAFDHRLSMAVAALERGGDFILIDQQGRQVRTVDPNYYGYLPLIAGAGAPDQITALSLLLQEVPVIGRRVRAAVWVGERRWNLTLDNMVEVQLPEEDAASALKLLAELDASQKLLSRDVKSIDLRLADRMVLQLNPAEPAAEDPKAPAAGKAKPANRTSTSGANSGQG